MGKERLNNNLDKYIYSLVGRGTTKHAKSAKMMTGKILFQEQSYRITGACFEVYKEKENGFREAVYQERFVNQPLSGVSRIS